MKYSAELVLLVLGMAAIVPLWADDGAMNNGAGGVELLDLSKGQQSPVRMVKEHLKFEYGKDYTRVSAVFYFKNMSSKAVTQLTGFPDLGLAQERSKLDFHTSGPLEDMKTFLDGKEVPSQIVYGNYKKTSKGFWVPAKPGRAGLMAFHTAELSFPPDGERVLERRYKAYNGISYNHYNSFLYYLITGATWKGTIGEMTAEVELKDGLTVKDLWWPCFERERRMRPTMEPGKDEWTILDNTHLRLVWKDFKPSLEKEKQQIQISNRVQDDDMPTDPGDWTVAKSDGFAECEGYATIYDTYEKSFEVYELKIADKAVSQMTGGVPLAKYLKPGDTLRYESKDVYRDTRWIEDLQKNKVELIRKNKQGAPVTMRW